MRLWLAVGLFAFVTAPAFGQTSALPSTSSAPQIDADASQQALPSSSIARSVLDEGYGPRRTDVGFRPFAEVGYGRFAAHQSFEALLGKPGGLWVGAGGAYLFARGLFVQAAVERFRGTGQRVFVFDGQTFPLGTADTVTMISIAATAGYRFRASVATPYVGGGLGRLLYRETFASADPSEDVSRAFMSYHVLAGLETRTLGRLFTAVEAQYTHVPNDLAGGAGEAFDEHDLGGFQVRLKLLFGER